LLLSLTHVQHLTRDTRVPVSEANVETLQRILQQLFESRRVDPALLAEEVEWVNPDTAVEPGTRRGADEFNRAVANVFAAWDDVHFDTDRLIDTGDDVLALGRLRGHIHGPGMAVESPHGQLWSFSDGRATRMEWFNTHREAMQAAGVRD
jgi:ketosteroid isomerase-like protein